MTVPSKDVAGRVYDVREETALRDTSQKTKTQVVVPEGSVDPVAVGDTRAPRIVAPATTPEDTIGS